MCWGRTMAPLSSLSPTLSLPEGVFPTHNVGRELVMVLTTMAADVALQGVPVAMASHVDGIHDMVQEKDTTVLTLEHPDFLSLTPNHTHTVLAHGALATPSHHLRCQACLGRPPRSEEHTSELQSR